MLKPESISAMCLVFLGLVHSVLGEVRILRPLFAASWAVAMPRWAFERIVRFAWHLTSVAWFALAAALWDMDVVPAVAVMSLVSAATIFVMLRGHLAWPVFLLSGLAAGYADGWFGRDLLAAVGVATAVVLYAAAALHVWWAFGGTWMVDRALPPVPEGGFRPGRWPTLAVAALLAAYGTLVGLAAVQRGPDAVRWLVIVGVAVLMLRAIGDTKVAGFTKSVRDTKFARADDRYFTPLVVFLALGASGALLVA